MKSTSSAGALAGPDDPVAPPEAAAAVPSDVPPDDPPVDEADAPLDVLAAVLSLRSD